jgi:hypothetical protein
MKILSTKILTKFTRGRFVNARPAHQYITASRDALQFEAHGRYMSSADGMTTITVAARRINRRAFVIFNLTMQTLPDKAKRGAAEVAKMNGQAKNDTKKSTYLLANPSMFCWTGELKGIKNCAVNDNWWRIAA